jgi:hypothetical protein
VRHEIQRPGEAFHRQPFPHRLISPPSDRVYDIIPFVPFGDEFADQLRRVLEISVHRYHGITRRCIQAGLHGGLVPKVPGQMDRLEPGVARAKIIQHGG